MSKEDSDGSNDRKSVKYMVVYVNTNIGYGGLSMKTFSEDEEEDAVKFALNENGYILVPKKIEAKYKVIESDKDL